MKSKLILAFSFVLVLALFQNGCQTKPVETAEDETSEESSSVKKNNPNRQNRGKAGSNNKNAANNKQKKSTKKPEEEKKTVKLVEVPESTLTKILRPFEKVEFTAAQKEQNQIFAEESGEEFRLLRRKVNEVLPSEKRKLRVAAAKQARADGKSEEEAQAAMDVAFALTPEVKKVIDQAAKEEDDLIRQVRAKVRKSLTDEQKKVLPPPKNPKAKE